MLLGAEGHPAVLGRGVQGRALDSATQHKGAATVWDRDGGGVGYGVVMFSACTES